MKKHFPTLLTAVLTIVMFAGNWTPVNAGPKSAEEFYKGKVITIHTSQAGSGMEIAARHMAEYLGKAIGAKIVVQQWSKNPAVNILNSVYRAKPDGLTMGGHMVSSGVQNWLLDHPTVLYKADELIWLGSWEYPPMALWTKANGDYPDVQKLMEGKGLFMAAGSPIGYIALWGTLAGHILGLDFKTVVGVGGPPPVKLSLQRDESQFTCISTSYVESYLTPLVPDLAPVVMFSNKKSELFPDVPTIGEVVNLDEQQKHWVDLATLVSIYNAPSMVFTPGVEKEKVDYIRNTLNTLAADPNFIEDTKKKFGPWHWKTGEEVEEGVKFFIDNKEEFQNINKLLQKYRAKI